MKEEDLSIDTPISYENFVKLLRDQKLYMTLYTLTIGHDFIEKLKEVWSGAGTSTSSSSENTKIMRTSCTIVGTEKDDAGANSYERAGDLVEQIDEVFGCTSSQHGDGGISCYISKMMGDNLHTLRSEGEYGTEVVKLEVFPYKAVSI